MALRCIKITILTALWNVRSDCVRAVEAGNNASADRRNFDTNHTHMATAIGAAQLIHSAIVARFNAGTSHVSTCLVAHECRRVERNRHGSGTLVATRGARAAQRVIACVGVTVCVRTARLADVTGDLALGMTDIAVLHG